MRALVYTSPWSLSVKDVPDPAPVGHQVRLRVIATGICGSDLHGFTGETGRRYPGQIMGHESVATVDTLGSDVQDDGLATGLVATFNPVIGCGICELCVLEQPQLCERSRVIGVDPEMAAAMAEYVVVPAANVVPLPPGIEAEYGALVEPLAVGYHAALRGGCRPDDEVLVIGGGPIGQACLLAARRLGVSRVVVSEPQEHRRAIAEGLGGIAIDPGNDGAAALADIGKATLVFDAVGSTATLQAAVAASQRGARIVLVGMEAPDIKLDAYAMSVHERTLIGSFCYSPSEFQDTAAWIATLGDLPSLLISERIDLEAAPEAFSALAAGRSNASKILIFPNHVAHGELTDRGGPAS